VLGLITRPGITAADIAAMFSGVESLGMFGWVVLRQLPQSRKKHDEEVAHRTRIEDEILGRPASQGLPATPSLTERLSAQDTKLAELSDVTRQLKPNGGSSLADKVTRIERAVGELTSRISVVEESHAQSSDRPNSQRNRRSPRPRVKGEGESK
jgi:hypothetical protein